MNSLDRFQGHGRSLLFITIWLEPVARYNARSDWPILGNYFPVMLIEMQNQIKKPYNKQLINSNVRSLRENLKPQACCVGLG